MKRKLVLQQQQIDEERKKIGNDCFDKHFIAANSLLVVISTQHCLFLLYC
jgi:hypothetical protein